MNCTEARELLSDALDLGRGEMPGNDHLLAPAARRAETEAHLAVCSACRNELETLNEIGRLFADFNVGELPPEHFENYGEVVRRRMKRTERKVFPLRRPGSVFIRVAASMGVAACLAFAVVQFIPTGKSTKHSSNSPVLTTATPPIHTPTNGSTLLKVLPNDSRFMMPATSSNYEIPTQNRWQLNRDWKLNWQDPKQDLDRLDHVEGRYGFVVIGENVQPNHDPLLGLQLRTTRDEDKVINNKELPGLKVFDVEFGSVAHEMGIMRGDLIVNVNGTNVDSGSASEAASILSGVLALGKGALVTIDAVRKVDSQYLYIQVKGRLGEPKATLVPADATLEN